MVRSSGSQQRSLLIRSWPLASISLGDAKQVPGALFDAPVLRGRGNKIGPEYGSRVPVFGIVEEKRRVSQRQIVGIDKEDFLKGAVKDAEGFIRPA